MLQFSEFVWALSYSVWDVFNKFFLIDATDISKIISDQKRFFIALSTPIHFSRTLPFIQKYSTFYGDHCICLGWVCLFLVVLQEETVPTSGLYS